MKLGAPRGADLTYCTNIHPGETWPEVEHVLATLVPGVKRLVSPDAPFGVGLRLSAEAAFELEKPDTLTRARTILEREGLYVFTLNGFPYGAFHGGPIKERVYDPDWQTEARVAYTSALARVLAALLPPGGVGSISTVPGCSALRAGVPGARRLMAQNLARTAAELFTIERESGKLVTLALEPEPACLLETAADAVDFFENDVFSPEARAELGRRCGLDTDAAEGALRRHLGVCLDTCHASVEFERPREALARLVARAISVPKIQLSAGLVLERPSPEALAELRTFDDGVYLHQCVVRPTPDAPLVRFLDLDQALAHAPALGPEASWRVHFHVPIFERSLDPFTSTQGDLEDLLRSAPELAPHLEVETYTFGVLPARYRTASTTEAIARELTWARELLASRG